MADQHTSRTSTVTRQGPPDTPAGGGVDRPPRVPGTLEWVALALLALGAAALRLFWLGAPVDRDEAGYLMAAAQWHPGTSLYGNYWVDRPPVLIGFYAVAHLLGGIVALRLMGCVLAAVTVLLGYALGRAVGERNGSALWPAAGAAAFVSTQLFDASTVNGELIAVPFVLAGVLAAVRGRSATRRRTAWWLAAGALGAAAVLVKQNFIDVFVFVAALALAARVGRSVLRVGMRDLAAFVGGAAALTAAVLAFAAWRGTSLPGLWEAVVVFRLRAGQWLSQVHDPTTLLRQQGYPGRVLASGALLVLLVLVVVLFSRRRSTLAVAAACLVAWEIVAIALSAQFWAHYLTGLVPGLVLVTALTTAGRGVVPTGARLAVLWAGVATAVALAVTLPGVLAPTRNSVTGKWLDRAARPGDTAVVLFGQANILLRAHVASPYEYLWSLPVRIQDPNLNTLVGVLSGPHAPEWVLLDHRQGMSPARRHRLRPLLSGPYVRLRTVCGYRVYVHAGSSRALPPRPKRC